MPEPFTIGQLQPFLDKHSLSGEAKHIGSGYINWVYSVGDDTIVRTTKQGMDPEDSYTEAVAVPAVRKAGVQTPELLIFDDDRDALDSVVTVYTRCEGVALGSIRVDQSELPSLYREFGREVARLHTRVNDVDDPNGWLDTQYDYNLQEELDKAFEMKKLETVSYDWFCQWEKKLQPAIDSKFEKRFIHNDTHAGNTMMLTGPLRLSAIIDWGDACWGDPAQDIVKAPVWAAPWSIKGYREEGGTVDDLFVGRVMVQNVGVTLEALTGKWDIGDAPWQPMASSFWTNLVRLMAMNLPDEWKPWLPDSPI